MEISEEAPTPLRRVIDAVWALQSEQISRVVSGSDTNSFRHKPKVTERYEFSSTQKKYTQIVFSSIMMGIWWAIFLYVTLTKSQYIIEAQTGELDFDASTTLKCHRKPYNYRITQTDANGKQCWDTISVMACWGRCDSNEVSTCPIVFIKKKIKKLKKKS